MNSRFNSVVFEFLLSSFLIFSSPSFHERRMIKSAGRRRRWFLWWERERKIASGCNINLILHSTQLNILKSQSRFFFYSSLKSSQLKLYKTGSTGSKIKKKRWRSPISTRLTLDSRGSLISFSLFSSHGI